MNIDEKYVVYELCSILDGSESLALKKVEFDSWTANRFDNEQDAIRALAENKMTYQRYVILKQVYIN